MAVLTPNRFWVAPCNDLEAIEIARVLEDNGERYLLTRQPWGATWHALERNVTKKLRSFRQRFPEGEILGIELAGPNPFGAVNIDHHCYTDDDRSHPLSSIEQVGQRLGVALTRWQRLVAANDRGYIPAMQALGASSAEIEEIRRLDRQAQGLTPADEEGAATDLHDAVWKGDRVLVRCAGKPTAAHADRLHGRSSESMLAGPDEWDYYGPRHLEARELGLPERQWSGGAPESGYFGIASPSPHSQRRLEEWFWSG